MLHELVFDVEFFARLDAMDAEIASKVAAQGCPFCGGPLHRGNYLRKPRGALLASGGEQYSLRYSFCCGWRDCRRRVLPPSLRFLGRRVYLEVVVLFATVVLQLVEAIRNASVATGVPARTLRRWAAWWVGIFPASPIWLDLKARFVPPPPDESLLPASLVDRLERALTAMPAPRGPEFSKLAEQMARLLAPATTTRTSNASRMLRAQLDGPGWL